MSWNNNSKGNKNSEYSINPGLTEKLRPLYKIKARLLDTALTSYQSFSSGQEPPENLTSSEFKKRHRNSESR